MFDYSAALPSISRTHRWSSMHSFGVITKMSEYILKNGTLWIFKVDIYEDVGFVQDVM